MEIKETKHSKTEDAGDVLVKILKDRNYTFDEIDDFLKILSDKSTEVINYINSYLELKERLK